jgi:REP element-mobilizing transposase RayT
MEQTIGYHIVISGYGLWLPGDERGSWSTAWDEQIGLIEPHTLHPGDPVRLRMSEERMKRAPVRLSSAMIDSVIEVLADCTAESDWSIAAASVETTHSHLLLTYTERNVDKTVKWIKDRTVKAIHRRTPHDGPVWCKGKWRSFIFDLDVWQHALEYIEQHNICRGAGPRPYAFIAAAVVP